VRATAHSSSGSDEENWFRMHRQAMLRKNPSEVKLEKTVVQSEETLRSREKEKKKRRE